MQPGRGARVTSHHIRACKPRVLQSLYFNRSIVRGMLGSFFLLLGCATNAVLHSAGYSCPWARAGQWSCRACAALRCGRLLARMQTQVRSCQSPAGLSRECTAMCWFAPHVSVC